MTSHYETRCPSCGGSDEQGCYGGCPQVENTRLRAALSAAEAKLEKAREALRVISIQKKTDELVTAYDVEYADFEGGYDCCVDVARAALKESENDT